MKRDVVILVGGRGTRLASVVVDRPKPLADVGGVPFLAYVTGYLGQLNIVNRIVLAAGHMADQIELFARTVVTHIPVEVVVEVEPLGTGGAIRFAETKVETETYFILNGDTIGRWPLKELADLHRETSAPMTLLTSLSDDTARYGSLELDGAYVDRFCEKRDLGRPAWVNDGVYCVRKGVFDGVDTEVFSLENDVLPGLAADQRLSALRFEGDFLDMGIPESYSQARDYLRARSIEPAPMSGSV